MGCKKSVEKYSVQEVYFDECIRDRLCMCTSFSQKDRYQYFSLFKQKRPVTAASLQGAESPLPVNLLILTYHFRVTAPKLQTTPHRPASVCTVHSLSCSSAASILVSGAVFKMHCIVTNQPSGTIICLSNGAFSYFSNL